MIASAAPVPRVPISMTHAGFARVAAHVAMHMRWPAVKSEMAAAHMKPGNHAAAMKPAATTCIRVAARK